MPLRFGNRDILNICQAVERNKEDIEELKNRPLLEIEFVDELPETGEAGILYLVPVEDGEDPNNYEEYIWANGEWELIGSTAVDISNMVTTDTDQEIDGAKTFKGDNSTGGKIFIEGPLTIKRSTDTSAATWRINPWGSSGLDIKMGPNEDGVKINGGTAIQPLSGSTMDIGADSKYFKEAKVNKYTVAASGYDITKDGANMKIQADGNPIVFRGNVEPTTDGTYALGKSNVRWTTVNTSSVANDYSALSIKGKGGISITCDNGSSVRPSQNEQLYLGSDGSRWNRIYVGANGIDFGNNAWIQKDGSNRIAITYNGTTKIKVGNTETYFVNHVEPDATDTYDLGRSGMYWRDAYIKNIVKGDGNSIATNDLVTKPNYANPDVFESGTLDANGQSTIDMTQTGIPSDGLYMFTYGNCQCFLTLTSTMIQNASQYPIRCTCPMMFNGSAYPGILKIERAADLLTLTVATAGVGNVQPSGFEWKLIKVM